MASGLGEPLNAEIELLSTTDEELSSLTAAIAPETAYSVQGLDRTAVQNTIRIDVRKKPNGTPVLKLSSSQPVTDPFVDMLIQVDWATGRLVREYTLLLDPPGYNAPAPNNTLPSTASPSAPATTVTPATGNAVQRGKVNRNGSRRAARNPAATTQPGDMTPPQAGSSADVEASGQSYTTARGDTLSSIANNAAVEGVSLDQMLVGIYRANKDAFVNGNMNRLKVGQILHIPTQQEAQSISNTEAAKEIKVHATDWNAYRNRLAGAVNETAAAPEEAGNQTASGKLTTTAEDKAATAPAGPRDVVRLSKNDTAANVAGKSAQEKMNALQEESIAKEKALQEANDRVAALEKQVQDMQKLLAIRSQAMSDLQKNATQQSQPANPVPAEAEKTATPQEKPETPVEPAKPATDAAPDASATTPQPVTPPPATPTTSQPEAVKKQPPQPEPVPEPSILENLPVDPAILGGALGGVLLLAGGWLFIRNKRKRNLDSFEKAILTSGGLKANTVFGNTLGSSAVDTGDTSFLTDFSPSGGGMIDTHDVDPIAEAEVYMAYGRDAQAEEILRDAIAKEPKRYELHQKLLEMYAGRKDIAAFETLAGEMYSTLGTNDPNWHRVAELGRKLEPENPLYQVDGAAAVLDLPKNDEPAGALTVSDFDTADFMQEAEQDNVSSLDFSLDETPPAEELNSPAEDNVSSLDFDLGESLDTPSSANANDGELDTVQLNASDFATADDLQFPDMETSEPETSTNESITAFEPAAEDNAGLDFQLDLPEQADDSTIQMDMAEFSQTLPGIDTPELAPEQQQVEQVDEDVKQEGSAFDLQFEGFDSLESNDSPNDGLIDSEPESGNVEDVADTAVSPSSEFISDISFDLDEPQATSSPTSTLENLPTIEEPLVEEPSMEDNSLADMAGFDTPDFDKTMIIQPADAEEIVFDTPSTEQEADLDFNLDIEDVNSPSLVQTSDEPLLPAEVDLSDINLDLDASPEETTPASFTTGAEPAEVDTKLDLVTAYMDMGDNEGARELLEEVLKEGGAQQRAKAEEILKSLA